jgi:hypothetical protein
MRPFDQLERDLLFGLEADLLRNAGPIPTRAILGPLLWQIEPIADRQAGKMICDRQRHRHLAIGFLAKLPAILRLHPNRMPALLGQARVVDDPDLDRPVLRDGRHHQLADLGQHLLVRPTASTDKMQQRLVLRRDTRRSRPRRHRLYTLALARQDQPRAVVAQRPSPIRVSDHAAKRINIRRKSCFASETHLSLHAKLESRQVADSSRL